MDPNYRNVQHKYDFRNKHVILTGATGGIGSLVLAQLLQNGATVVALVRKEIPNNQMWNDYIKRSKLYLEKIDFMEGNLISPTFQRAMLLLRGKWDSWILCHGMFHVGDIEKIDMKQFDENWNINVRSCMHLISVAVPFLKYTKGNIVVSSSLESKIVEKDSTLNAIMKSMVNSLVENTALEVGSFGIRVNAVAPGITNTTHRVSKVFDNDANIQYLNEMKGYFLLNGTTVNPEEVANGIMFWASDESEFMTGEIMVIDNGFEMNHDLSFNQV